MKVDDAIKFFGTKTAIATAIGVSKSYITHWGDDIPPLRACQIHLLTKGKVKAVNLQLNLTHSLH
jgi:DNA-binding transcriptional regulator YdaS (Cro superfamily)